jgi:hypothetical protein
MLSRGCWHRGHGRWADQLLFEISGFTGVPGVPSSSSGGGFGAHGGSRSAAAPLYASINVRQCPALAYARGCRRLGPSVPSPAPPCRVNSLTGACSHAVTNPQCFFIPSHLGAASSRPLLFRHRGSFWHSVVHEAHRLLKVLGQGMDFEGVSGQYGCAI